MIKRQLTLSALALALAACSSIGTNDDPNREPTLGDIAARGEPLKPSKLPPLKPDQAIGSYEKLLKESQEANVRAESLRRLADLTLRNAEQRMVLEADESTEELSPAQKAATFDKAVALYQQLLQEFPNYKNRAAVQYQLAKAFDLMAEREASLNALATLAQDFPGDTQFAEAQFRRGEAMFVERKWVDADAAYSAVLAMGEGSGFYDQSLYKRGWTRFKQSRYDNALQDFFPLIERLQKRIEAAPDHDKQVQELSGDTYRVVALSFSYIDGPRSVEEWFAEHGHQAYEPEVYRGLATLYLQQERYKDAADTYQSFVNHNRFHDEAPAFETAVIETYQKGNFPSLVLPAKEAFAEHYGRNSEYWKQQQQRRTAITQLLPQLQTHIRDVAQHYHALAQKSKDATEFRTAARWYREFLETFPNEADTPKLHFLMSEALFDANDLPTAAQEFEKVAYDYPPHEKSEAAGYAALVSYQNLIRGVDAAAAPAAVKAEEKVAKSAKDKKDVKPVVYPAAKVNAWRKPAIVSGTRYATTFAQNEKAPGVLSSVINWQIAENDIPGAIASARTLINLPQTNDVQRREARIVVANGEFDLGNFAAAELAYGDALAAGGLDPKVAATFRERRAIAVYKQAEMAAQQGDKRAAVQQYLRLAQVEPNAPVRANAEYDAAALLLELEDWSSAIAVLESFRRNFATHQLAAGVTEKLAFAYEKNSQWGKAADEYTRIANATKDLQLERDSLWHAAALYEKGGERDKTITAYRNFITRFDKPYAQTQEARIALIKIYGDLNDAEKRDFWRRELIKAHGAEKGDKPANITYRVAEASFALAEPLFTAYEQIPLKLPLNKSIKAKRDAMQKAMKAYEDVARYSIAEFTVASNYKMGELYRQLAEGLMKSERPKGLDQDALDEYDLLLEEQSTPFEDKAIEIFESTMAFTKNGIYNSWIDKTLASLAKVNPARYGKTEYVEKSFQ